jgi:hypothetical protein
MYIAADSTQRQASQIITMVYYCFSLLFYFCVIVIYAYLFHGYVFSMNGLTCDGHMLRFKLCLNVIDLQDLNFYEVKFASTIKLHFECQCKKCANLQNSDIIVHVLCY